MFAYHKISESRNTLSPSWSEELILTYNGRQYNVTKETTKDVAMKIGDISYHGKISGVFELYSIKNVNDYSSIAVKTKEGYLIATTKEHTKSASNNAIPSIGTTESSTNEEVQEQQPEVVNTIENGGNPIQIVINVGAIYAPIYVNLGQTTKVRVTSEEPLFIYLKNKDLLSYEMASNLKQPMMVITAKPNSWKVYGKNPIQEPNSIHCGIVIENLSDKTGEITIEKIYDKDNKQILKKPITFKLELSDEVK